MIKAFRKGQQEEAFFGSFRYFEHDACGPAQKSERPDFLIEQETRKIGVEVTALYTPDREIACESTKDAIVELSKAEAARHKLPPLSVTLFFSIRRPLKKEIRSDIASKVVQTIKSNMPKEGGDASLDMLPGQPPEVDLITVYRRDGHLRNEWQWMEAGTVIEDSHLLIQKAIDRKAPKLSDYLTSCDECWLLIGVNSFRPSGKIRLGQSDGEIFQSSFQRTYFLDYGRGKLFRLRQT